IDVLADGSNVPAVENEDLPALGVVQVLECCVHGLDGTHRSLAAEGITELEQEVIPGGDRGDIDRRPVGHGAGGGAGSRALQGAGGIRRWTGHKCVSAVVPT